MSSSAYAPYQISYAARTPYISVAEYQSAPTAMDTSNLVSGGPAQQVMALQETIGRASSWMDQVTCGAWGTLCSTVEVENGRVWGSYRNTLPVNCKYWPLVEVQTFAYSSLPGGLASANSASITPAGNITVYPQYFEVAPQGSIGFGLSGTTSIVRGIEYDCQWQYVAGWPNTALAASVAAGGASITPAVVTGIYPGTLLTVYDLPNDEAIQVASNYVPGASVVPLVSPLQYYHGTTATVTNLPPAIKQAAILATTAFIKQRGSGALIYDNIAPSTHQDVGLSQGAGDDWYEATLLLQPFRQMLVGT